MSDASAEPVAVVILAAGKSTRMRGGRPKVLHEVCGRPMLWFGLTASRAARATRILVIVGHGREAVCARFHGDADVAWVVQSEQRGTGHAVLCCRHELNGFRGTVVVLAGDMPLVRGETLAGLVRTRVDRGDAATIATTELDHPAGYGRIVRDPSGGLERIIEHRDCSPEQLRIREINPSFYAFASDDLFTALDAVEPSPGKGELYLTDAIGVLRSTGRPVSAVVRVPPAEALGVNSREDLSAVNRAMQQRLQARLMDDGVTIVSPENTWIEADVQAGEDTTIYPFSFIGAGARLGRRCRVGPHASVGAGEVLPDDAVVHPAAGVRTGKQEAEA